MRFPKEYQPDALIDPGTVHLASVHLDVEKKTLSVSNNAGLAILPVTIEEGDTTGRVSDKALKEATKLAGKAPEACLKAREYLTLADGKSLPRPKAMPFPETAMVFPAYKHGDKGTLSVAFSLKSLIKLAQAIGVNTPEQAVVWTFPTPVPKESGAPGEMLAPIVVQGGLTGTEVAILMPMRLDPTVLKPTFLTGQNPLGIGELNEAYKQITDKKGTVSAKEAFNLMQDLE